MKQMITRCYLLVLLLILTPSISMATWYTITDPSGAGAGTVYYLEVLSLGGNNYSAVLKAYTANTGTNVYLDWFQIKFDGGTAATIGNITLDPVGTWNQLQSQGGVNLAEFGTELFATNGWSGLYLDGAVQGASFGDLSNGPELDGGMKEWNFLFTLSAPLNPTPSLQVGYYYLGGNPNHPEIKADRLSEKLTVVPEANTMMLLISGLVGSGVWRRMKRYL